MPTFFSSMFRTLRASILTVAVGFGVCFLQGASGPQDSMPEDHFVSLRPILEAALRQSPAMLEQQIRLAQADASRIQAAAGLYPSLRVNGDYSGRTASSDSGGSSSTSETSGLNYGANLSQDLFQWGAIRANAEIGRLGEKLAERNFEETFRLLLGTLRSQYLGLVIKKAALERARFAASLAEDDLRDVRDRVRRGVSATDEISGADLTAQRVRLAADRAAEDFETARRMFIRISGVPALPDSDIPAEIPRPEVPIAQAGFLLSEFLRAGLAETPQAQVLGLQLRQSVLNYKVARSGNLPKFNVGFGYSSGSNTYVDGGGTVSQSVVANRTYSLGMNWSLYDGGSTRGAKRLALSNRRSIERQTVNYTEMTRDEAIHRERLLGLESRALAAAELDREIGASSLQVQRDYFQTGQVAKVEVDRSTASYNNVELATFSARAAYLQQWAEFVSLVGADPMMDRLPASLLSHGQ